MSLNSIINTATSGLLTAQFQIAVASDNIASAANPGATQKTYTSSGTISLTSNLSSGEVTRITDSYLSKTVNAGGAADGASTAINDYLQNYDNSLGSVADGNDVSSLLTTLQTALSALQTSPSSGPDKGAVINAASALALGINTLSGSIQALRTQASSEVGTTVTSINNDLQSLQSLNKQITAADNAGADATGLEDQRDSTLTDLSSMMGVQYYTDSKNQLVVYDNSGDQLLGAKASTLSYASTGMLSSAATYPSNISGIMLNGSDITNSITTGKLGGLIQVRDQILPGQQDQLDQLASSLIDAANAATNTGTAYPAPTSLTSDGTVAASDSFSATGVVRIATVSANGAVASSADLDLSSYTTVSGLLAGLNGISGISASISPAGKLVIQSTDPTKGVAINGMTSSVGAGSKAFSDYFGFNDLFSGTDASTMTLSKTMTAATLPTATLSGATTLAVGASGIATSDPSAAMVLANALTQSLSMAASGSATAKSSDLATAASTFVSNAASIIATASGTATQNDTAYAAAQNVLANTVGVSVDQQTALLTQYQSQYEANTQLLTAVKAMFATLLTMMQG